MEHLLTEIERKRRTWAIPILTDRPSKLLNAAIRQVDNKLIVQYIHMNSYFDLTATVGPMTIHSHARSNCPSWARPQITDVKIKAMETLIISILNQQSNNLPA